MDYLSEYRSKLRTAQEAVKCVKSGDWVEYTTNNGYPPALDKALSERRDELRNVKIRGDLLFGPIHVVECDPTLEHFVYSTARATNAGSATRVGRFLYRWCSEISAGTTRTSLRQMCAW